jgi:holin-like protein
MIEALTFLLLAQLLGEVAVRALAVPVPGPVVGMAAMAAILAWRGIPAALRDVSGTLLRNLSLLFVPAGVGIVRQAGVLADYWLALLLAIAVSTVLTLTVTVLTFVWVARRLGGKPAP